MVKGDNLIIKEECKDELVNLYKCSGGMSGLSKQDIDHIFIYIDMDGSNIRAMDKETKQISSLNYERFLKK